MVWSSNVEFMEALHILSDEETGLQGVIAIHSTALGPAAGGCRLWHYPEPQDLVTDAMRLARGMSYKNALAGLPFGGAKAVLQRPVGAYDRAAMFRAYGDAVQSLGGSYVTAEDVGTTVADMETASDRSRYVAGMTAGAGRAGGDPSPWTARGVFAGMRAAATMLGVPLGKATVAIQGTGNVGGHLARLLKAEGARLIVADVDEKRAHALACELGARQVGADEILSVPADVLAPCALGSVLNDATIPQIRAQLVCGAANNQLAEDRHGDLLRDRRILYVPDYVVNAGGIVNVCAEYLGESETQVVQRIDGIALRVGDVLQRSLDDGVAANRVADAWARHTIASARRLAA